MKLLCLHGYGTNAECLRAQLLPTMNAVGGDCECIFVEGEFPVGKSVFTGNFDPPYWAYYKDPAFDSIAQAHELIEEAIEVEGPFDGILGFSQGAALAMSYLLHQRITRPDEPSKFKFGVFFSTGFIVSPECNYKENEIMAILNRLTDDDTRTFYEIILDPAHRQHDITNASFMEKLSHPGREIFSELAWEAGCVCKSRVQLQINDTVDWVERLKVHDLPREAFPRFFNPIYTHERLSIPTVHCWGHNDSASLKRLSLVGRELCADGRAFFVEHSGHHELPVTLQDAKAVADAIEKAFYLGRQQNVIV
ncbi:serine hydrolase FSH [Clohesyomyces aquaticus]|uniref:Serine hydrolase FSH n=1 Tax=Clohesyomyces aquaticus TaxID=1231657 RepID=A0A1Y1YF25_9PLEO|nr:serine hydrolase FSH [Clohesyomyces aquaticus]